MISRRTLLQQGATASVLAGVAVATVQCQPPEAAAAERDPLASLIQAYREQLALYNASPLEVGKPEDDDLAARTWLPPYLMLCEAPPAATSLNGVREAMQLVADEEEHCGNQEELTVNVLRAALAYFDEGSA